MQELKDATEQQAVQRQSAVMQKRQYKFALENEILEDPRTELAFNEFAPITNMVLGTGTLKRFDKLRDRYPKIISETNCIETGFLTCDCCLSSRSTADNKLVYCELCLNAVHVNCHGRKLLYASQGKDGAFDSFVCERCKYYIDNDCSHKDYERIKCKFCDELKGILIFLDKNDKKAMMIGWAHLACVFWHPHLSFADQ